MNGKKKILFVKIVNRNLGDSVIADCSEYLLKKALGIRGRLMCDIIPYDISSKDLSVIKYVDAIVFDGGGMIKFFREAFYLRVIDILETAERLGVPAFFNAVGVEGYDENDERCLALQKAINLSCVKGFSIRDDAVTLRERYLADKSVRVCEVFDPAVWCDRVYDHAKSKQRKKVIGLCIARARLFQDYAIEDIDHDRLLDFWTGVVDILENKGYTWEIFTNGLDSDELFAKEVLSVIGHGIKRDAPVEPQQLVSMISSYEGIIGCRMHTNIIAYSFGIPSVGFIWNNKLALWGKKIGYPERFISPNDMTPEKVVCELETALKNGTVTLDMAGKSNIIEELRLFLEENLYGRQKKSSNIPFKKSVLQDKMFSIALGSEKGLFDGMNTLHCFRRSFSNGFKNFETDIRLTSDRVLVCVNSWSPDTYRALGRERTDSPNERMSYDRFMNSRYYGCYVPMAFSEFLKVFSLLSESGLLYLDLGKPSPDDLVEMLGIVKSELDRYRISLHRVIFRTQRKKDVDTIRDFDPEFRIAFQIPSDKWLEENGETFEKRLSFALKRGVRDIALNHSQYTKDRAAFLKKKKVRVIIQKANMVDQIMDDIDLGAYLIGTNRTSPKELLRL